MASQALLGRTPHPVARGVCADL